LTSRWNQIKDELKAASIHLNVYHKKNIDSIPDDLSISNLFDRHGIFFKNLDNSLRDLSFKGYYDEWGINSPLYLTLFNPPEHLVGQIDLAIYLLEACFFKILVVDERIAERAFDAKSGKMERFKVLANMGVFVVTHLGDNPIGKGISKQAFSLKIYDNALSLIWQNKEYKQFHFLVIHQGVIENEKIRKFLEHRLGLNKNSSLEDLVRKISHYVPFVVIDSGRGKPANIPENAKFLTFSSLQDMILRENPAKCQLTQALLRLTRRKR
jgi:hypothetical protein